MSGPWLNSAFLITATLSAVAGIVVVLSKYVVLPIVRRLQAELAAEIGAQILEHVPKMIEAAVRHELASNTAATEQLVTEVKKINGGPA